ncbi:ferritin-like domain-containing protein [Trametes polyzona]|nr:ferritin-like domain-containing protein [Trametes polyzona]
MRVSAITSAVAAVASITYALPFTPAGGLGTNSTPPVYRPLSDFDLHSLNLALHQEYIELDLFHNGLAKFSAEDFEKAGLGPADRYLMEFMADQEVGHATMITNIVGPNRAAKRCNYTYPFHTVREFVDFSQKLTRFGESGTYGFLEHLNSRPSAELLLNAISTEARQQMIFRQFEGLFPTPFWFVPGITQSMHWTLLAPYITSCPAGNFHLGWQNFPALTITNNPNASTLANETMPAISRNRTQLSAPGKQLHFSWEAPGKAVGPNGTYTTSTNASTPQFVAWISQLNTTFTPFTRTSNFSGTTVQPGGAIFGNGTAPVINGTVFVALTDSDPYVTPFNLTMLNPHIVAGPALYQSG